MVIDETNYLQRYLAYTSVAIPCSSRAGAVMEAAFNVPHGCAVFSLNSSESLGRRNPRRTALLVENKHVNPKENKRTLEL